MVKKINKKHCSHDAYKQWEHCFLFIFFTIILPLFYYYIFFMYVVPCAL